jgi:hypothetical protein
VTEAIHRDDQRVRAAPFADFELDLAVLWSDLANQPPGRASEAAAPWESPL